MGTIFISGATSGLGMATAEKFAADGWNVVGAGRRPERLAKLSDTLGGCFHPLVVDVRDRLSLERSIASLPGPFSDIDVLVNNAGLFAGSSRIQDGAVEDWENMVDTNIKGLLFCTRAVLGGMLDRKRGHIINIGSAAGSRACPTAHVYGASKAFVRQLSENMRSDLLGTPIRVTCIAPGRTRTEFSLVHSGGDFAKSEHDYDSVDPLLAVDIADAIRWIVGCPPRMDVSFIEIMPTGQADAGSMFRKIETEEAPSC